MAANEDALNAEIAAENTEFTTLLTALGDASKLMVTDLEELLARPPADFTAQVAALKANAQRIADGVAAVQEAAKTEDQKVNPPGPSDFTAPQS